ncbi:MAG: DUF1566 domain-containing protein [Deltaproteobacteria bacterium]|nr:DUF1566 domain-containing protein [Deltaproteobacteria bacterium]
MRRFHFLAIAVALFLGLGLAVSCGDDDDDTGRIGGGDDDDDSTYIPGDDDADDDDTDDDTDDDADDDMDDDSDDDFGDLIWQDPPMDGHNISQEEALEYCANLSFDEHDDWRLPTISELRSLILGCDATEPGGSCSVTDDCPESGCWNEGCYGCDYLDGPSGLGAYWPDGMHGAVTTLDYWSSSTVSDSVYDRAWLVDFGTGGVEYYGAAERVYRARCVHN